MTDLDAVDRLLARDPVLWRHFENSPTSAARSRCEQCGGTVTETFPLAFAWPPESDRDPGRAALHLCGGCAEALATNVLVDRSVSRGLDDVYAGVEPGESIGESGRTVPDPEAVTEDAEPRRRAEQ